MRFCCFFLLIILLLTGCSSENSDNKKPLSIKIEKEELPALKELILENYNLYDSVYFRKHENVKFKNFVMNEIDSLDMYFDFIHNGISVKQFGISYDCHDWPFIFSIIRDANGKYYYLGHTDNRFFLKKSFKYYITNGTESYLIFQNEKDLVFMNDSSRETEVINTILSTSEAFRITKNSDKYDISNKLHAALNLVFRLYFAPVDYLANYGTRVKQIEQHELKKAIYDLDSNDYPERNIIIEALSKKMWYHQNIKAFAIDETCLGILIFSVEHNNRRITFKKEFIPKLKTRPCWAV